MMTPAQQSLNFSVRFLKVVLADPPAALNIAIMPPVNAPRDGNSRRNDSQVTGEPGPEPVPLPGSVIDAHEVQEIIPEIHVTLPIPGPMPPQAHPPRARPAPR